MCLVQNDVVDAPSLLSELNHSTTWMMALPIEQVGSEEWHAAVCSQEQAFSKWQDYIYSQAYGSSPK